MLKVHTALGGRQRIYSRLFLLLYALFSACLLNKQALDHPRSLAGEYIGSCDLINAAFFRYHRALDGIAAKREEIVIYADILYAEDFLKRRAKHLLHIGFGCDIIIFKAARLGSFKSVSVELAVLVNRKLVELYKKRGNHIRRKLLRDRFFYFISVDR